MFRPFKDFKENEFWLTFWMLIISGLVSITGIVTWYFYANEMNMKELILKGKDPLELSCMSINSSNAVQCALLMQNHTKK